MRARHAGRAVVDVALYAGRTGRWWLPVLAVVLGAGAAVLATAKVVVPTVVYTLF